VAGKVADAKVVGNKIDLIFEEISKINREDIIQDVIAALGTPVFGRVNVDNNIILTGKLAKGTYTLKYEMNDGTMMDVGEIDLAPGYTNIIDTVGYTDGIRLSTSAAGETRDADCYVTTNVIDLSAYSYPLTIRTAGVDFDDTQAAVAWYNASDAPALAQYLRSILSDYNGVFDANGNMTFTLNELKVEKSKIRICGYGKGADLIVTINEEII
jgi:hypothetical protein